MLRSRRRCGKPRDTAELTRVDVSARHGDRTPVPRAARADPVSDPSDRLRAR